MLLIYCPNFTERFKSRIQVDAATFKCPHCNHIVTHDKKYMRLVEENGDIITLE